MLLKWISCSYYRDIGTRIAFYIIISLYYTVCMMENRQMKVMFVDSKLTGHHRTYLKALMGCPNVKSILVADKPSNEDWNCPTYSASDPSTSFLKYKNYIKSLIKIAEKEKPDVIHLVYGDSLYRYFGYGLKKLSKKYKTVITFHQIRRSFFRDISYKMISRNANHVVVHTDSLLCDLHKIRINNLVHIEYPYFGNTKEVKQDAARKMLGLHDVNGKILLCLGGTRYDKGLDLLLDALNCVEAPFHLLIAGKEEYFSSDFIKEKAAAYLSNVTSILGFLDDEIFSMCVCASDIVVLPYRKQFDGASGPLGEGVRLGKQIIGPNHGSLGRIITEHHLGKTFIVEDVADLAYVVNNALKEEWTYDEKYQQYRGMINPLHFVNAYLRLYSCD